mmetsp:Transcript_96/g.205  ORF Transcript_96/g.205 Transcript_96/m.205 type:complete len:338 (+) Transcript_96:144-1157(+)
MRLYIISTQPYTLQNIVSHQRKRVTFVSFPHKALHSGEDAQCRWVTGSPSDAFDPIQNAAYTEGMCIPPSPHSSLHVFSTAEAIECLSPTIQNLNISITVGGDSYTRQLFIGLADILLGRPSKEEIRDQATRLELVERSNKELAARHGNDSSFPNVQFPERCFWICFGSGSSKEPFSVMCSNCINSFTKLSNHAVAVVGAGVHVLGYFTRKIDHHVPPEKAVEDEAVVAAVNNTIDDLKRFFILADRTIYVSMPCYQTEKVPLPYKNATHNSAAGEIYEGLLPYLAPHDKTHPFVDVFQLTRACHMDNCSYDGGHRSRYVNRWKAQLLLNTLCDIHE